MVFCALCSDGAPAVEPIEATEVTDLAEVAVLTSTALCGGHSIAYCLTPDPFTSHCLTPDPFTPTALTAEQLWYNVSNVRASLPPLGARQNFRRQK